MDTCKENCEKCYETCLLTFNYCVAQGGAHIDPNHLMVLRDCIEICRTAEAFLITGSRYHALTCAVCERICKDCAESCLNIQGDNVMEECASVCMQCSESCATMAKKL